MQALDREFPDNGLQPLSQPCTGSEAEGPARPGGGGSGGFNGCEDRSGGREEALARFGEADGAGGAVEELDAELAFEPGDLLTHAGLADAELLGGAAEVQYLRDRDEVLDLPKLHVPIIAREWSPAARGCAGYGGEDCEDSRSGPPDHRGEEPGPRRRQGR
ncbi:hypothetical protein GCM10009630_06380 [Kribbella jejuensis]